MEANEINGYIRSMTTSVYASLDKAWVEYLQDFGGTGTLIASIHPNSWRHLADGSVENDVVARAIVFMPADEIGPAHLARLVIRFCNTEINYRELKADLESENFMYSRVNMYMRCLELIEALPVVDLWELGRAWPVTS